jgi:hypothetical protein
MRLITALREIPSADLRALARGMARLLNQMGIAEERAGLMFDDTPASLAVNGRGKNQKPAARGTRTRQNKAR